MQRVFDDSVINHGLAMAKKIKNLCTLVSPAGTRILRQKISKKKARKKLVLRKFDPKVRQHVVFTEE